MTQVITTAAAKVGRSPWTARDGGVPAPAARNAAKPYPPESSTYPASEIVRCTEARGVQGIAEFRPEPQLSLLAHFWDLPIVPHRHLGSFDARHNEEVISGAAVATKVLRAREIAVGTAGRGWVVPQLPVGVAAEAAITHTVGPGGSMAARSVPGKLSLLWTCCWTRHAPVRWLTW